jgi:hypothetical protein
MKLLLYTILIAPILCAEDINTFSPVDANFVEVEVDGPPLESVSCQCGNLLFYADLDIGENVFRAKIINTLSGISACELKLPANGRASLPIWVEDSCWFFVFEVEGVLRWRRAVVRFTPKSAEKENVIIFDVRDDKGYLIKSILGGGKKGIQVRLQVPQEDWPKGRPADLLGWVALEKLERIGVRNLNEKWRK